MTDQVAIAMIGALAGIPATIGSIAAAWFSYKSAVHSREGLEVGRRTQENTDGMKDQLVSLTDKAAYARGKLDESNLNVEQGKSEQAEKPGEAK